MDEALIEVWVARLAPFVPALAAWVAWGNANESGTFEVPSGPDALAIPRDGLYVGWLLALALAATGLALGVAGAAWHAAAVSAAVAVGVAACLWRLRRAQDCPRCDPGRVSLLRLRGETGRDGDVRRYRVTVDCDACDLKATARIKGDEATLGVLAPTVRWSRRLAGAVAMLVLWQLLVVTLAATLAIFVLGSLALALFVLTFLLSLGGTRRSRRSSSTSFDWDRGSTSSWKISGGGVGWGGPSGFSGGGGGSSSFGGGDSGGGGAGRGF